VHAAMSDEPSLPITAPAHGAAAVDFPFDLASTAISELRRAGRVLDEKIGARNDLARPAQADWSGPHRDEFDEVLLAQAGRAGDVAEACRSAAASIEEAWASANTEQSRLNRLAEDGSTVSRRNPPL
jgi:hypothetical protein